jgi:hypothetical protein
LTPRRLAFVGPTLPPSVRPDLGFEYLPPIRHGDLFAQALRPGDQVLIVDGVYQHFAPIRHKEILAQLARGVRIAGAASLGALRAAELADFGMRGLGRVYQSARAGRLVADADVAVLHGDDASDAHRLTVAMVSFRQAVTELSQNRQLTAPQADELEDIAARLHFSERSERALRHAAAAGGYQDAMRLVLDRLDRDGDIKTRDALEALHTLVADPAPARATHGTQTGSRAPDEIAPCGEQARGTGAERVWESVYGREWEFEYRPLRPGSPVRARQALACLQLFASDFPLRHRAYAYRLASAASGCDGSAAAVLAAAGFTTGGRVTTELAGPTAATADWTPHERLLARTFRLRPGRLAYLDVPAEALAGSPLADVEQWCSTLMRPTGAPPAAAAECHALLRELWQATSAQEYRLCVLERGLRDADEAARLAGAFDLAFVDRLARHAETAR